MSPGYSASWARAMPADAAAGRTQPLWFFDNLVHVLLDVDTTRGALTLLDERGRRGNMPPLHVHRHDDEAFYVLEGELTLFAGGEQRVLSPGKAALAPRDVPHAYRVESDEARWLVITTPAGFDAFVREVAEPAPADELPPAGRPFDPAALAQAAAKVGIEILGVPGTLPT
jgi:mannose-6-phosphate isomerase-like protein (cupin superfamily)